MAESRRKAQSIIEFLTANNPDISPTDTCKKRNTSRHDYYYPRELREWKDFTYEALEVVFGGELIKEAKKKRFSLPHYPHLDEEIDQRLGSDEPSTRSILTKWNHTIVLASLRQVQERFHPCLWREKLGAKNATKAQISAAKDTSEPIEKSQNDDGQGNDAENKEHKEIPPERKSARSRQPDGGSVSVHETKMKKAAERFPKEYKPASNWNSQKLSDGLYTDDETGEWLEYQAQRNENAPIRQAYTYCVDYECRYGCILTTKEAFIFRIQPRKRTKPSENTLIEKVKKDGLMEFVSIPWGNGCDQNHETYRKWTVNLALWFTHILAGNNYKIDWKYPDLRDENIVEEPQQPPQGRKRTRNAQSSASQSLDAPLRKRRKQKNPTDQEEQDAANYSFSDKLIPRPNNRELAYISPQSERDSGDDDVEGTVESPPLKQRLRSVAAQGNFSDGVHGEGL